VSIKKAVRTPHSSFGAEPSTTVYGTIDIKNNWTSPITVQEVVDHVQHLVLTSWVEVPSKNFTFAPPCLAAPIPVDATCSGKFTVEFEVPISMISNMQLRDEADVT